MKKVLYIILRAYVWLGLQFYFSKISVYGRQKIPKKGALMFTANHQNAFLDALLIVTNNGRNTHFLARAEVFKKDFVKWLLSLINMMPIFRIRDGFQSLSNNEDIFKKCYNILGNKDALLIFPEGNHGFERRLRPLSKGFTRIAFGTLDKFPSLDLKILPTGINYEKHQGFRSSVSIHYGDKMNVIPYYKEGADHLDSISLRNDLSEKMKELIVHIDERDYENEYRRLVSKNPDFSDLDKTMDIIRNPDSYEPRKNKQSRVSDLFYFLFRVNYIIPLLFWKIISKKVKDPVMLASIKFSVGISVFPLMLLTQSMIVYQLLDLNFMLIYFFLSLLIPFGIKND